MKYAELGDTAKQKARDWMLECMQFDDFGIDELLNTAALLGFSIDPLQLNWSVESGVAFTGQWFAKNFELDKLREEWPQATELHAIGAALMVIMLARPTFRVDIGTRGESSYWCSYMQVTYAEEEDAADSNEIDWDEDHDADEVLIQARALAGWMHTYVKDEWEFRCSIENLEEHITCNDYEFDEDGNVW